MEEVTVQEQLKSNAFESKVCRKICRHVTKLVAVLGSPSSACQNVSTSAIVGAWPSKIWQGFPQCVETAVFWPQLRHVWHLANLAKSGFSKFFGQIWWIMAAVQTVYS